MSDYGIRSIDSQHSFASSATPSRDPSPSPSSRTSSRARSLRDSLESLDVATQETTPTASTTSAASASRSIHAQDHSTSPIATPAASSTATTSQGNDGESPFQAYERYKVDAPHPLASFLSSSEVEHPFPSPTFLASPPMAPMSSSSVEGSPELRGQHWEDSRSCSHGGSTSGEGSGAEGGHHQLVMPSMRLPPPESHSEDQQMRSKGGRPHSRLLLAGRTRDERDELARLLGGREGGSRRDTELSFSFLSTRLSDKSRNSSHQTLSTDWDELIEEMHFRADSTTFYQPRSSSAGGVSSSGAMELAAMLQAGLEGKERFIDGTYPSTQSLADFVGKGLDGELEGALMLFSSRAYTHLPPLKSILTSHLRQLPSHAKSPTPASSLKSSPSTQSSSCLHHPPRSRRRPPPSSTQLSSNSMRQACDGPPPRIEQAMASRLRSSSFLKKSLQERTTTGRTRAGLHRSPRPRSSHLVLGPDRLTRTSPPTGTSLGSTFSSTRRTR